VGKFILTHYEYRITIFRAMLFQLSPAAARRIEYENAEARYGKPAGGK